MMADVRSLVAQLSTQTDPAVLTAADAELTNLAYAGDAQAQRALIDLLGRAWAYGAYDDFDYACRCESIARVSAGSDPLARKQLIGFLLLKGHALRAADPGLAAEADRAQGEALVMIDNLADAGDDEAAANLVAMGEDIPASAYVAAAELRVALLAAPAPVAPMPTFPPFTLWERVRFWFSDRWWDAKFLWWDLCAWADRLMRRD